MIPPDEPERRGDRALLARPQLKRRLGLFDTTMLVMGGIIGAGIFMNPHVVARYVHRPSEILGVWVLGGLVALAGAFVYAELSARMPEAGGPYVYLREVFHPVVAFAYGWALLLVIQAGGMAAVAITFARYVRELTGTAFSDAALAAIPLAVLTVVNVLGVRAGSAVQSALTVLKVVALAALVVAGMVVVGPPAVGHATTARAAGAADSSTRAATVASFAAALVPVIFAYGGWQSSCFVAGEVRAPERNLPRALVAGVLGVVALYVAVNVACLHALGPFELAATATPASAVMRRALGDAGGSLIAGGIALSALGFLSQSMLTAPRVYFAMARDGVFFDRVAYVHPRTRVPVVAVALQGAWAIALASWGRYEQILDLMVPVEAAFYALTGACVFVLRRRGRAGVGSAPYRVPGHPVTTAFFVGAFALLAASALARPREATSGLAITLTGVPVYFAWRGLRGRWGRRG